jgi:hypothetical protein
LVAQPVTPAKTKAAALNPKVAFIIFSIPPVAVCGALLILPHTGGDNLVHTSRMHPRGQTEKINLTD